KFSCAEVERGKPFRHRRPKIGAMCVGSDTPVTVEQFYMSDSSPQKSGEQRLPTSGREQIFLVGMSDATPRTLVHQKLRDTPGTRSLRYFANAFQQTPREGRLRRSRLDDPTLHSNHGRVSSIIGA